MKKREREDGEGGKALEVPKRRERRWHRGDKMTLRGETTHPGDHKQSGCGSHMGPQHFRFGLDYVPGFVSQFTLWPNLRPGIP